MGRQVYVTQRSSCSCGWGMCSWRLSLFPVALGPAHVWWLKGWRRTRQAQHRSAAQMAGQRPAWAFLQCASSGWTLTVKRGPFLALAQERNRVRLPSQITSLGRFYWLEGPGLSASHPPTLGRQVYVTQRSSCSCGWGMCSWPLRPTHMSVRTCNAR